MKKLIELNIDELSGKAWYRLGLIDLLGRASAREEVNIQLKSASTAFTKSIALSDIHKNEFDIVVIINEKYAKHARFCEQNFKDRYFRHCF